MADQRRMTLDELARENDRLKRQLSKAIETRRFACPYDAGLEDSNLCCGSIPNCNQCWASAIHKIE